MSQRLVGILILAGLLTLAVLLYRSTASYPAFVQGSTASYVRFLAMSMGILCAAELLLSWRRKAGSGGATEEGSKNPRRFWALLVLIVVYALALDPVGFFPASAVFLPATMVAMGARRPLPIVLTTAGILAVVHVVFTKLLEVQLPKGTLF